MSSTVLPKGYGSIFVRVFNGNDVEIDEDITEFRYMHSEYANDSSTIVFESESTALLDHPDLQEGKVLKLIWGYITNDSTDKQDREVRIWDLKPTLTVNGIRLELVCYCKAAYMMMHSSTDIWSDFNLEKFGEQMAETYGLDFLKEGLDEESPVSDDVSKNLIHETGGTTGGTYDIKTVDGRIVGTQFLYAREQTGNPTANGFAGGFSNVFAKGSTNRKYLFKNFDEVPQATKSDAQLGNQMASLEPNENVFFSGEDNKLILRKRKLNQEPIKTFQYKKEPGEIISFTPASKNLANKDSAITNITTGWDEESQEFISAWITNDQESSTSLGDMLEQSLIQKTLENVKNSLDNPFGSPVWVGGLLVEKETDEVDENGNKIKKLFNTDKIDSTGRYYTNVVLGGPNATVVDMEHDFISAARDTSGRIYVKGIMEFEAREFLPTVENNKNDIAGAGVNRKSKATLEKEEGTLVVIGDPALQSAKIISILNIGTKYSGNYYISNVEHRLNKTDGYICTLKVLRKGIGKVGEELANLVSSNNFNIVLNNKTNIEHRGTEGKVLVEETLNS